MHKLINTKHNFVLYPDNKNSNKKFKKNFQKS